MHTLHGGTSQAASRVTTQNKQKKRPRNTSRSESLLSRSFRCKQIEINDYRINSYINNQKKCYGCNSIFTTFIHSNSAI